MKIEEREPLPSPPPFKPIVITVETEEEAAVFRAMAGRYTTIAALLVEKGDIEPKHRGTIERVLSALWVPVIYRRFLK